MRYEVGHELDYRYSSPVFLEPHTLYLRPRQDAAQRLHDYSIEILPRPAAVSDMIDAHGNACARIWFEGLTDRLSIVVRSDVEVRRPDPFDYLPDPARTRLPVAYDPCLEGILQAYLTAGGPVPAAVRDYAATVVSRTGPAAPDYVPELCRTISGSFEVLHRAVGAAWPSDRTLASGQGACRDLAMLMIDCCRAYGLAARFVSGYFEGDVDQPDKDLHGWVEVYIEGGGWRGFDPTHGLAVAEQHIVLASALPASVVAPVSGAYRGSAVSSLKAQVNILRERSPRI